MDAVVSIALEKLAMALMRRVELSLGATSDLKELSSTFRSIQASLHDAENRQFADAEVRNWLSNLKQASYDIEDLLNEQLLNSGPVENKGKKVLKMVANLVSCGTPRYEVACRVAEIRKKLDQISEDRQRFNFTPGNGGSSDGAFEWRKNNPTGLIADLSEVIGRERDEEIIISKLVGDSGSSSGVKNQDGKTRVIAVVGPAGMGKTTLAQAVCNSKRVKARFDEKCILWVYVSQKFDVVRIMKAVLENLNPENIPTELSSLQTTILDALKEKRFLLVLDDVWNFNEEEWRPLQSSLTSGASGSRVLVTTRMQVVAKSVDAVFVHELAGLPEDVCWNLFSSRAFARRKEDECSKLQDAGKAIVKNCGGVPLSVKVMGNAMLSKSTVADWQNISRSPIWLLKEAEVHILPPLLMSYFILPPHLKQCFAYCSIYGKESKIRRDEVVKLWVAQGFIRPHGEREMEDIATEYFEELVALSLLQQDEAYPWNSGTYEMHDLLHDLAQFIMKDESAIFVSGESNQCSATVRHVSLFFCDDKPHIPLYLDLTKLRTLFLQNIPENGTTVFSNMFHQSKFLRALSLKEASIEKLPPSIGELKHLAYLDMSGSEIVELPESVGGLANLLTLKLNYCCELQRLPNSTRKLIRLRHLEILGTDMLQCLPKGMGRIRSLQTLNKFIVGVGGSCGGIEELRQLNSLRGSLKILYLDRVPSKEEASKAELGKKQHITALHLSTSGYEDDDVAERVGNVLEGLKPHEGLEALKISAPASSKLPSWLEVPSFLHLTSVKIKGAICCTRLPGLGKLPALKYLTIKNVGIRELGHEFYFGRSNSSSPDVSKRGVAFPKLEELSLFSMKELKKWGLPCEDDNSEIMPSLNILVVHECCNLEVLPHHLVKLTSLEVNGCGRIQWMGCSFPQLETFTLKRSKFFSERLPNLPNLKIFHIEDVDNERLTNEGWEQLRSLETFTICGCSNLGLLPDGLGQLKALRCLEISFCEALESLPRGLGDLPHLPAVSVSCCSLLLERHRKDYGVGWPKIEENISPMFNYGHYLRYTASDENPNACSLM